MEIYLVGGAVRDALLGLPVKERDWVVVGARPDELVREGYQLVGRDFPVFLHPQTHEEYALARVERKTGPGYHGFAVAYSPDVTLEEDLRRRDLTINAIAQDARGALYDPYGGRADLAARVLRHVSEAFAEDPVRILRVARFAARFARLGFTVAEPTQALMTAMVRSGEAAALVAERVWTETAKALREATPAVYFTTLAHCGALAVVYPELGALAREPARWQAALEALDRAAAAGAGPRVRFAALVLGLTDAAPIDALCARTKVPVDFRELALLCARLQTLAREAAALAPHGLLELLEAMDAFRRAERAAEALEVWRAAGIAEAALARIAQARATAGAVVLSAEDRQGLAGPAYGARLRERRLEALAQPR